jgi:hypothetical protein
MTVLKPSREIYLFKLGTKQFFLKNKMIKKKIIPLILKDDITFKGVVS